MAWMSGVPRDDGGCPQGSIDPVGVVAHRTYGSWSGDYSVGSGSSCPTGFHFLVGKETGKWVQFYSSTTRCAHAGSNANGNDLAVAIEVEGTNEQPFTAWQLDRVAEIVDWLQRTHGIAPTYRYSTKHDLVADRGYIPHSAVKGADHSDYWTQADWDRIVDRLGGGSTSDDPRFDVSLRQLRLTPGSEPSMRGDDVASLQLVLSDRGFEITIDGIFGADTDAALRSFQDDHGLADDGILGPKSMRELWEG